MSFEKIDALIEESLSALAEDPHVSQWHAKENNWVSYFVFRHLLRQCRPDGVLSDPAQVGIEVSVPQPKDSATRGVRRDIVIWPASGMTCWSENWEAVCQPMAIIEWKVHRRERRIPLVWKEREWLRRYCGEHRSVVAYAIEVNGMKEPRTITCCRYLGDDEKRRWLKFPAE